MSLPTDPVPGLEVLDLRETKDESLLQAVYTDLYVPNFPMANEAEDPSVWRPLLWNEVPCPPQPLLRVLVAGHQLRKPDSRVLVGFIFLELYRQSGCGLVTYIAVGSGFRGRGVAGRLLRDAETRLLDDARRHPVTLQAIFGEVNNPERVSPAQDSMDPRDRVRLFDRLGVRWVPMHYVQPPLGPNQSKCYSLDLVVMPRNGRPQDRISGSVITGFLHEFYRALGIPSPELDADFCRMAAEIGDEVVLHRP
jgi:GNAT superfamily N-acetyltransferase